MLHAMSIKLIVPVLALVGLFACAAQTRTDSMGTPVNSAQNSPSTMKESIIGFTSEPRYIRVTFSKSARPYDLQVAQDNFVAVMTKVATAYKSKQEVVPIVEADRLLDIELE